MGGKLSVRIGDLKLTKSDKELLYSLVDSGMFSEGRYIREFERKWASYVGTKGCVTFNSGTSAMMAGFVALQHSPKYKDRVRKGSKAITTPLTYIATVNSVVTSGLEPVFVDVKDDFNIDEEKIAELLESSSDVGQYSIILPVHLLGYACEMDRINSLAKKYGLIVFEDAAEAHGSTYKGKRVGSLSTLSDFSFYMAHAVCAGELGTLHMNDPELKSLAESLKGNGRMCCCTVDERAKGLCPHAVEESSGIDPRYFSNVIGFNFKATEFQALLGLTQISKIGEIIRQRQENVRYLNDGLAKYSDALKLPEFSETVSYLSYPVVIEDASISRKRFRDALAESGIESRPLFGCIPTQQPAYAFLKSGYQGKVPKADYFGSRGFYIGCHQFMPQEQLDYVIKTFGGIIRQLKK
ncbi:DegT/DnrJ/EryC1/StrS family aminotransferase [Candidatus Woesearchaeota archaeon]|nr:DegT/DnrJ/EryC1/StrS family aminotransferase [Candidatus Woesearchaeota archaeon]